MILTLTLSFTFRSRTQTATQSKKSLFRTVFRLLAKSRLLVTAKANGIQPLLLVPRLQTDTVFTYTYEKIPDPTKYHYTINKHFYNEKDVEVKVENGKTKIGNEYALVAELYKNDAVNQTVDGKTYVYVPGLTKVTDNLEKLTKDVTIDLYYYLDVKGGEKPDETGNGTPDAWEYRLAFKVVNGEWNNGGSADIVVYVPFKDNKTWQNAQIR